MRNYVGVHDLHISLHDGSTVQYRYEGDDHPCASIITLLGVFPRNILSYVGSILRTTYTYIMEQIFPIDLNAQGHNMA